MLPPLTLFWMDIKPFYRNTRTYGKNEAIVLGQNHCVFGVGLYTMNWHCKHLLNSLLVICRRQSIQPNRINEILNRTVWNKSPILSWFSKWKTCIFSPVWLSLNEHRQCIVSFCFSLVLRQHLISQVLKFTALRFRIYIEIILEGSVHVLLVSHTKLLVTYPYRAILIV